MNDKNVPMIQFIGVDPDEYLMRMALTWKKEVKKTISEIKAQKEEFLTAEEVADLLKVTKWTISRYSNGEKKLLSPRKIGNTVRYKRSEVEAVLNRKPDLKKNKP